MNFYLLGLSFYGLMIMPVTLRFRLRLGKHPGYRVRVQAAGLPFARKRSDQDTRDEQPIEEKKVAQTLAQTDWTLVRAMLSPGVIKRLLTLPHFEQFSLIARFSFPDACHTALAF